jgi:hypothetical protein
MVDGNQSKGILQATELAPEELQAVFDRIDEYLSFWEVLHNDEPPETDSADDIQPVSLSGAAAVSDWLKMSSAPLYPSQGAGGARGLGYRFLNLVIKIFGLPQIGFNRKLRDFLGELVIALQAQNAQAEALKSKIKQQNTRIRALEMENGKNRQDLDALAGEVEELRETLDRLFDEPVGKQRD